MTLTEQINYMQEELGYNEVCLKAAKEYPATLFLQIEEVKYHEGEIVKITAVLNSLKKLKEIYES